MEIRFANDDISDGELDDALGVLERLNREVSFKRATEARLSPTMATARQAGSTFYDASYVTVADHEDLTLVTEDGPQKNAATNHGVSVLSLADLAE